MEYNIETVLAISDATIYASSYIDTATNLTLLFIEKYFEQPEGLEALRHDINHRPYLVESQISAIYHFLFKAKQEIDVFSGTEPSAAVSLLINDAQKKQNIINIFKEK